MIFELILSILTLLVCMIMKLNIAFMMFDISNIIIMNIYKVLICLAVMMFVKNFLYVMLSFKSDEADQHFESRWACVIINGISLFLHFMTLKTLFIFSLIHCVCYIIIISIQIIRILLKISKLQDINLFTLLYCFTFSLIPFIGTVFLLTTIYIFIDETKERVEEQKKLKNK